MGRILALDYGQKRTGIAVTDSMQMIASGLTTVPTAELLDFLSRYFEQEDVEMVVVGEPRRMDNTPSGIEVEIGRFIERFGKRFPQLPVRRQDERFSSKMAVQAMIQGGMKKKKRRDKAAVDKISATLILQSYLSSTQL
ncbi:Holliday junction resolvase RuvX [Robiginitalea sp. SC105]|uniref:Holliday junction resolvase RuvX n=1 Tax=Robiginitalea sp. SC105 TaxID=2762332 RepID=UPI00163A5769|nr:Holliday junction resolvase RuvX [Robiginitalea sp. SC105]MBC2839965.1 Holliday junction resolvase RuvX [Robiginitalea sp. SC105]